MGLLASPRCSLCGLPLHRLRYDANVRGSRPKEAVALVCRVCDLSGKFITLKAPSPTPAKEEQ